MNKAKEILMKGFNADCKEDENIIDLAIKEAKKEVFDDIEKQNKAVGYIHLSGGFYLKLRDIHLNTSNTEKLKEAD